MNDRSKHRGDAAPTWCPRRVEAAAPPPPADGVWCSDRERRLARALVAAIDRASEMVVVSTFLLADDPIVQALLRAATRGVRVYLLLASEARLDRDARTGSTFERELLDEHRKMLGELAGWALVRTAPSFHAKALLVDPASDGPGFLLTANLTSEALERNEELAIALEPAERRAVLEHLAFAMWQLADHELLEPGRLAVAARPERAHARPPARDGVVATLDAPGSLRAKLLEQVNAAKRTITVASFGWDAQHDVVRALCARAREGVRVTVLARVRPTTMPALSALLDAGARVLGHDWLHAKAMAIDEGEVLVSSANLERSGLDEGFELGVVLDGPRAAAVRALLRRWETRAPFELLPRSEIEPESAA